MTELESIPTMDSVVALAAAVGGKLEAAGFMCTTAESCTGGLIGHIFTECFSGDRRAVQMQQAVDPADFPDNRADTPGPVDVFDMKGTRG